MIDKGERHCTTGRDSGIRQVARSIGLLILALPLLAGVNAAGSTRPVSREYQVKAAFLYNFTKFVDWPPERFPAEESPLVIGILGDNPFGDELEMSVEDRQVNGRGLDVRYIESADEPGDVHVVFVAAGQESLLNGSIDSLHNASILTIGESRAFRDLGGIITFTLEADRVRFFINRTAAEEARLRFNVQLLRLALNDD